MAETTKPDLTYVCPNCGQKAVIGNHFCKTRPAPEVPARKNKRSGGNRGLFLVVGGFFAVVVLWRWLGPGTLVLAALGGLAYLAWGRKR